MSSFLNTYQPKLPVGLSPTSEFADAPRRVQLQQKGFSRSFKPVFNQVYGTPGVNPMGMAMNSPPVAWAGCFDRDSRSGIVKQQGLTTIQPVKNPTVNEVHNPRLNAEWQRRGRYLGQAPGKLAPVKLSC